MHRPSVAYFFFPYLFCIDNCESAIFSVWLSLSGYVVKLVETFLLTFLSCFYGLCNDEDKLLVKLVTSCFRILFFFSLAFSDFDVKQWFLTFSKSRNTSYYKYFTERKMLKIWNDIIFYLWKLYKII